MRRTAAHDRSDDDLLVPSPEPADPLHEDADDDQCDDGSIQAASRDIIDRSARARQRSSSRTSFDLVCIGNATSGVCFNVTWNVPHKRESYQTKTLSYDVFFLFFDRSRLNANKNRAEREERARRSAVIEAALNALITQVKLLVWRSPSCSPHRQDVFAPPRDFDGVGEANGPDVVAYVLCAWHVCCADACRTDCCLAAPPTKARRVRTNTERIARPLALATQRYACRRLLRLTVARSTPEPAAPMPRPSVPMRACSITRPTLPALASRCRRFAWWATTRRTPKGRPTTC